MSVNTLLYYKHISNICKNYDAAMEKFKPHDPGTKAYNEDVDSMLYTFGNIHATYCTMQAAINNSELSPEMRQNLQNGLDHLKDRAEKIFDVLSDMYNKTPNAVDPTGEIINLGNYVYKNGPSCDFREQLEKMSKLHTRTSSDVNEYSNLMINSFLDSRYKMEDVAVATHKLAKSKAMVDYFLAPAAQLEKKEIAGMAESIKRKMEERENRNHVNTTLTSHGYLCALRSQYMNSEDQRKILDHQSVRSVKEQKHDHITTETLAKKKDDQYTQRVALITNDRAGLKYTQQCGKYGEIELGKWSQKGNALCANVFEFKTQTKYDGTNQLQRTAEQVIDLSKKAFGIWNDLYKSIGTPIVEQALDAVFDKEHGKSAADAILDPDSIKVGLKIEDNWGIVSSKTDLAFLMTHEQDQYMQALQNKLADGLINDAKNKGMELSTDLATRIKDTAYDLLDYGIGAKDFAVSVVKNELSGSGILGFAEATLNMIHPYKDFESDTIQYNAEYAIGYADKILKMAALNDSWLDTQNQSTMDDVEKIVNEMSNDERNQLVRDTQFVNEVIETARNHIPQDHTHTIGNR